MPQGGLKIKGHGHSGVALDPPHCPDRSTILDYAIAFLRAADEIRMPVICRENAKGEIVVSERQLFAVIRRSAEEVDAASVAPSLDPNSDTQ
jgi:hypothetical protein